MEPGNAVIKEVKNGDPFKPSGHIQRNWLYFCTSKTHPLLIIMLSKSNFFKQVSSSEYPSPCKGKHLEDDSDMTLTLAILGFKK